MTINTSLYCEVLLPTRDSVLSGPRQLSQNYKAQDGKWKYNIWDDAAWTDSDRIAVGLYPYIENDAGAPGVYYNRTLSDYVINPTAVVRNAIYTQWPIEEVRETKNTDLESQLTEYTTNQRVINPSISEYIYDDAKWLADEQAKLARLTEWDDVAAFPTAKPVVLALPNSYVGQKNVRQGVALTAQNTAAEDSGISPIWDQVEINAYVAGNQLAADDESNATAPVSPHYSIRQGVANVSEQFNRIIVWRFDVEHANPSLRRSIAMQMSNRQDSRDLIAFIYGVNFLTYLGWKRFEDKGNGVWRWELDADDGDGSIMTHVDSDVSFILSYGTNPSYEPDFFTDRIEFPAGVEEDNILVAWDPV